MFGLPLGILSRRGLGRRHRDESDTKPLTWRNPSILLCGFVAGSVGAGLMMSTLGMILKERTGDTLVLGSLVIGVASLNGLLLTSRWAVDFVAGPILGHLSDRINRRRASQLFFGAGAVAMFAASTADSLSGLVILVVLFFVCGVGATVVMMAEAGDQGSRVIASYLTASDMGSATGPMVGWLTFQAGLDSSLIFLLGGLLYTCAVAFSRKAIRHRTLPGDIL